MPPNGIAIAPKINGNSSSQTPRKWPSVTIIVAATPSMGMSYDTHLPWPKLKRENEYFESTTKRTITKRTMNAVIMGYNTWDDEPTKLFSGRINVVVTRDSSKVWARLRGDTRKGFIHVATSLEDAVQLLERTYSYPENTDKEVRNKHVEEEDYQSNRPHLGRIFIIGGAELCRQSLRRPWVDRLLLTRVRADFKVDTLFPLVLDGRGNEQWQRQSDKTFRDWGGPGVPIGVQSEKGIEWEAFMFERIAFE
jgi:dihydrofolate reductase